MWKFEKRAGLILDQQDDPGVTWEKIAYFWPDELGHPDIGVEADEDACTTYLTDGHEKIAKYPTDTPENALASSMYFLMHGIGSIEKNAHQHIAEGLKNARIAWDVKIPEGFIDFIKEAHTPDHVDEVFADDAEHLPVTSAEQCLDSVDVFTKHANKWSCVDRMIIGRKLQKSASYHGLDVDVPYSRDTLSKEASGALNVRRRAMEGITDHPYREAYINSLEDINDYISKNASYEDILEAVEALEELDKEASMDLGWGVHYPDPVNTFIEGVSEELFPEVTKTASYGDVDFGGLKETFSDDIVDSIASDPETVIPTLPGPQKKIVEDYINGR